MKRQFEVSNLDTGERYLVSDWKEGKDNTDKSAIQEAMKFDDVITMGHTIVCPIQEWEKKEMEKIGKMFDSIKEKEQSLARIKRFKEGMGDDIIGLKK